MLVFVADVLKGVIPVLGARWLFRAWSVPSPDLWLLAVALAPILGHTFSIFLGFRGGRAVATTLGVLLAMVWQAAAVGLGVWILVVAATRYISAGSIAAAVTVPVYLAIVGVRGEWAVFWTAVGALIILRHTPNLGRLLEGRETKIGERVTTEEG